MSFDLAAIGRAGSGHRHEVTDAAMQAYAEATDDVSGGPVFAIVPVWNVIAPASQAVASGDVRRLVVHHEQDMLLHRPLEAGMRLVSRATPVAVLRPTPDALLTSGRLDRIDDVGTRRAPWAVDERVIGTDDGWVTTSSRSLLQKETKYAVWQVERPLRPTQYYFGTETRPSRELGKRWYTEALELQAADPVKIHESEGRTWWWFRKQVYVERERLAAEDVKALALQLEGERSATLERAHAGMRGQAAAAASRVREPIPEPVRHEVWRRDQGRCVDCGSRSKLEFDHIIPWSQGGSNTARNLELRCESCNRKKGADV